MQKIIRRNISALEYGFAGQKLTKQPNSFSSDIHDFSKAYNPSNPVQLTVAGRDIVKLDLFSASDPMVICYLIEGVEVCELCRTEVVKNESNPAFCQVVLLDNPEKGYQRLKFSMYDIDSDSKDLTKHDYVGEVEISLYDIMDAEDRFVVLELVNHQKPDRKNGFLVIKGEELQVLYDLEVSMAGFHLDKMDFLGKSDPYMVISKQIHLGKEKAWTPVAQTEVEKGTLNPIWKPFTISNGLFFSCDEKRQLKFECYDWNLVKSHPLIGSFETTAEEIMKGKTKFDLRRPGESISHGQIEVQIKIKKI